MAEDEWSPRENVVDVAVAVHVDDVGAFAPIDEERRPSDGAKRAHRGADAAR
jgi:hypothetical protein